MDFHQTVIERFCFQLALSYLGLENSNEEKALFQHAKNIFLMTNRAPEFQKDGLDSAVFLSTFLSKKMDEAIGGEAENLLQSFSKNKLDRSSYLSLLIQMFVGLTISLPLLIGNLIFSFYTNKNLVPAFKSNPSKLIGELLRFHGPSQFVLRQCLTDTEVGNHHFKKGEILALCLAQANRDENEFHNPELVNIDPQAKLNLSLGKGEHTCLGAGIIRESCLQFCTKFLDIHADYNLDERSISYGGSDGIRGVTSMTLTKN